MKPQLLLSVFALWGLIGCREEDSVGKEPPRANREATQKEEERARESFENAKTEFANSAAAVEKLRGEERMLRSDLRVLEDQRRDLTGRLKAIEEEKAKIKEEIVAFQKRLDVESEGFEHGIDQPLIEVYRKLLEGREDAKRENKELKEKLKEYEAVPKTR